MVTEQASLPGHMGRYVLAFSLGLGVGVCAQSQADALHRGFGGGGAGRSHDPPRPESGRREGKESDKPAPSRSDSGIRRVTGPAPPLFAAAEGVPSWKAGATAGRTAGGPLGQDSGDCVAFAKVGRPPATTMQEHGRAPCAENLKLLSLQ